MVSSKINWTRRRMRGTSEYLKWTDLAAVQAAIEENRGGGERGSDEPTEFCTPERAINGSECAVAGTVTRTGSTKVTGVTAGLSGLWQQDMLHCATEDISWPQSIACS